MENKIQLTRREFESARLSWLSSLDECPGYRFGQCIVNLYGSFDKTYPQLFNCPAYQVENWIEFLD